MATTASTLRRYRRQTGLTMVELLVALAIGSFLIIGAVQVYNQSRQAFVINESIARVQETAQFALDTLEADLRMASNWGQHSRADAVEGRSLAGNANPLGLGAPVGCGADWALDLTRPLEGDNNAYTLACDPPAGAAAQADSDTVTARRASVAVAPLPLQVGRLYIQTTRVQGELFDDGAVPSAFDPARSETHNLLVNTYYVADNSALIPGVPTLRRKSLVFAGGVPGIEDQEVAPGVENLQIQFGVDVDADNTIDRYVNPDNAIITPGAAGFIPAARVITARVWLVVRSLTPEPGLSDDTDYEPGDRDLGQQNDGFRRLQVSKTILLRNART